jgi:hypothetical protein
MAIQALIEGDATLTEQLWFQQFGTQEDMQDLQNFATNYASPVYDSAPIALKEALTFPYLYGSKFTQTLYSQVFRVDRCSFFNRPAGLDRTDHASSHIST